MKTVMKLALVVAAVAAIAAVISVVRAGARPVTTDEWPEVPTKPAT